MKRRLRDEGDCVAGGCLMLHGIRGLDPKISDNVFRKCTVDGGVARAHAVEL